MCVCVCVRDSAMRVTQVGSDLKASMRKEKHVTFLCQGAGSMWQAGEMAR